MGYYYDDYVGCDVERGLGYCYNGDAYDENAGGYGNDPPAVGIDFFEGPLADLNDGVDNDSKTIYKYVAVAAYFRVFVLLRDARFCVDASASAPEEALELGGAGAPDVGAFKMSDGPDSSDFAERSGDADGRRFCGVDLISAFTLGRATPTPPFDISSSSLQNPSGKSAFLGVLWASMRAAAFFGPATSPSKSKMRLMPRIVILT